MHAGLLLALFAHLLLMASPLHAAEPPLVGRHEPGVHAHLAVPASLLSHDLQLHDAHCGLQWSPPRSGAIIAAQTAEIDHMNAWLADWYGL